MSRNAIARKHGVSASTVTKLARDAGLVDAFDRTHTEAATAAAEFDARQARRRLIEDLYSDAQAMRERMWSPYTQVITGPAGPEFVTTKLPPIRDQQSAMGFVTSALTKAVDLEKVDADGGAAGAKTMMNDLFGAMQLAYYQIVAEDAAGATGADRPASGEATAGDGLGGGGG